MADPVKLRPVSDSTPQGFSRDTLTNLVTGLGVSGRDRNMGSTWIDQGRIPVQQLDTMYRTEWLAAAVVDYIPEDMMREWRTFDGLEPDEIDELQDAERVYKVEEKILKALKWARLYGGCGVIMMIDGAGEMHEPLDPERIRPGALQWLQVIDRYWMFPDMTQLWDPTSEHFGEPQHYRVYTGSDKIHRSRILMFEGFQLPYRLMLQELWWGSSVLERVREALQNAVATQNGIASLIQEAKVDVIKIPHLFALLQGTEGTEQVMKRIAIAQTAKSIHNALLLDTSEEWEQKQIALNTGLQQLLEEELSIVAAAADISVTRLLGESAKGLNATGEGDLRNYYDSVKAKRNITSSAKLIPPAPRGSEAEIHSKPLNRVGKSST